MKKIYRIFALVYQEFLVQGNFYTDGQDTTEGAYIYQSDWRFPEEYATYDLAFEAMEDYFTNADDAGKTEFVIKEIFSKK